MSGYTVFFNETGYSGISENTGCYLTTYTISAFWTKTLMNVTNILYIVLCSPQYGCPTSCQNENDTNCLSVIHTSSVNETSIHNNLYNYDQISYNNYTYIYGFSEFVPTNFSINFTKDIVPLDCSSSGWTDIYLIIFLPSCIFLLIILALSIAYHVRQKCKSSQQLTTKPEILTPLAQNPTLTPSQNPFMDSYIKSDQNIQEINPYQESQQHTINMSTSRNIYPFDIT